MAKPRESEKKRVGDFGHIKADFLGVPSDLKGE
jgi:hypothetical protein